MKENQPIDALIGKFSATDEDMAQILIFSLVGGDSKAFYIDGRDELKIKGNLSDYESKNKYTLVARVTDNAASPKQVITQGPHSFYKADLNICFFVNH